LETAEMCADDGAAVVGELERVLDKANAYASKVSIPLAIFALMQLHHAFCFIPHTCIFIHSFNLLVVAARQQWLEQEQS